MMERLSSENIVKIGGHLGDVRMAQELMKCLLNREDHRKDKCIRLEVKEVDFEWSLTPELISKTANFMLNESANELRAYGIEVDIVSFLPSQSDEAGSNLVFGGNNANS